MTNEFTVEQTSGSRWYAMKVREKIAARVELAGAAAFDDVQRAVGRRELPTSLNAPDRLSVWEVMQTTLVNSRVTLGDAARMVSAFERIDETTRRRLAAAGALQACDDESVAALNSAIDTLVAEWNVEVSKATKTLSVRYPALCPMLDSAVRGLVPGPGAREQIAWFRRTTATHLWLDEIGDLPAVAVAEKALWFDGIFPWAGGTADTLATRLLVDLGWRLVYWPSRGGRPGSATDPRRREAQSDGCVWKLDAATGEPTVALASLDSTVRAEIETVRDEMDRRAVAR